MIARTRRTWLWTLLLLLIAVLLGSLVWLVGRYEQSRFEDQQEIAAQNLANDIRDKLARSAQRIQVLSDPETLNWGWTARQLLEQQPEMLRIERRDAPLHIEVAANSPLLKDISSQGVFSKLGRANYAAEVVQACAIAARSQEPAYSISYFVPLGDGTGYEVTDMCLPRIKNNKVTGYLVTTYSLDAILKAWGSNTGRRQEEITFTDADGSRLASLGAANRQGNLFTVKTILSLQGLNLILSIHSWHSAPYWLANIPTALVLILVLALFAVLWLLYRDTRKRLRTEAKLAREIIQQRKTEEISRLSLERLQKSARLATLGEMASMLSHELNQPLAAIASYASGSLNLLMNGATNQANAEDIGQIKVALERITAQSERAGLVIKSVHDFVRRRETERALVDPQALLDAVLPLLGLQAKQMNVQLVLRVAKNLPPVWCDKTLVEQVIINLARNGMQAMGMQTMGTQNLGGSAQKSEAIDVKHRILTLSAVASHTGGIAQVEFQVADRGAGLSQAVCDKLFTPFFTTKMEGMGLGLSLCRTVIEQHGSTLTYTTNTKPPQTGTTFSFKLMTDHAIPS
jgi:signal transduction histidine kinase